ncbi:MAG: MAPEG family protein [Alcanivorax sp.]|uniref:MAPEG family protein n=1 Tax=Alcanivorax sp. TaxID=1872427 RepID=UPI003DA78CF3
MEGVYFYLILSGLLTISLWVPYIIARLFTWGLPAFLHSYPNNPPELPAWAQRSQRVHLNMVETLPALLAVIIPALALMPSSMADTVAFWVQVFFYARVTHAIVFTLAIPYLRTSTYLVSWFAIVMIAVHTLRIMPLPA